MKRRRTPVQSELFTLTSICALPTLSAAVRIEVVQALETLLRELVRAEILHPTNREAGDEQDRR
jgi:hypothetical protein